MFVNPKRLRNIVRKYPKKDKRLRKFVKFENKFVKFEIKFEKKVVNVERKKERKRNTS